MRVRTRWLVHVCILGIIVIFVVMLIIVVIVIFIIVLVPFTFAPALIIGGMGLVLCPVHIV